MVLGHPVAAVPELLGELREVERVAQRLRARPAFRDRRLVEDGEAERAGQGADDSEALLRWRLRRGGEPRPVGPATAYAARDHL